MNTVRTEWHLADVAASEDPFARVTYSAGAEIDLTAPEGQLRDVLTLLLEREGRLDASGLSCPLKDGGQDCRSCPRATLSAQERRSALCRLGKDQRLVAARIEELVRPRMLTGQMARAAEEFSEVGHLSEELAEWLTVHGL